VKLLHHRLLNGWPLFWLIAGLTVAVVVTAYLQKGVATPEAAVNMIRLSVQLASPWVFLAFVATPMKQLLPGNLSKWLLRNRRYLGLSFAVGFGWQAVFIGVLLAQHNAYYWETLHNDLDLLLRMASYVFLFALTVTSFFPVRRKMRREHWRALHLLGIWYFWAAIWVSYAGQALSSEARAIDMLYTFFGLLVLALRIAAYLKMRTTKSSRKVSEVGT
jgi:methionine sulfoxide reductase heme-binding subunit